MAGTALVLTLFSASATSVRAEVHSNRKNASIVQGDVVFTTPQLLVIRNASGEQNISIDSKTRGEYVGQPLALTEVQVGDRVAVTTRRGKPPRATRVELLTTAPGVTQPVNPNVIVGTLVNIDRQGRTFTIATGAKRVSVDIRVANDASGRHLLLEDYRVGDQLFVQTSRRGGALPLAELVRFADHREAEARSWGSIR